MHCPRLHYCPLLLTFICCIYWQNILAVLDSHIVDSTSSAMDVDVAINFHTVPFETLRHVGRGKFGLVYSYTDSVAIKRIVCENLCNSDEAKRKYEDSKMDSSYVKIIVSY